MMLFVSCYAQKMSQSFSATVCMMENGFVSKSWVKVGLSSRPPDLKVSFSPGTVKVSRTGLCYKSDQYNNVRMGGNQNFSKTGTS